MSGSAYPLPLKTNLNPAPHPSVVAGPRNHFDRTNVSVTQNRPFTGGFLRFGGRQGDRDHGCDVANKLNCWLLIGTLMDQDFVDQRADDLKSLIACLIGINGRMQLADLLR